MAAPRESEDRAARPRTSRARRHDREALRRAASRSVARRTATARARAARRRRSPSASSISRAIAERSAAARAAETLGRLSGALLRACRGASHAARLRTRAAGSTSARRDRHLRASAPRAIAGARRRDRDIHFEAGFGRPLDYYTGLVFEVRAEGCAAAARRRRPLRPLMEMLGAKRPVPAVGFTMRLDLPATGKP